MSYGDGNKQMFEGNWKCGGCGSSITKLPFKPDPERVGGLKCVDCFKNGTGSQSSAPKQMYEGNWKCSRCGGTITRLPFKPDPTRENTLTCIDCFKKSRV